MHSLKNIDIAHFLQEYWQKKPLVIRQGFTDFIDPLDEHDLAGLAMEDEIDSRIVSCDNNQWHISHGPFEDINQHLKGQWSLLVQSVDHHITEANELLNYFDFIPQWRIDDLMVSYSVEGAGVGPHLDQYDVFIIQGKGQRRWQVGEPGEHQEYFPHPQLRQVNAFAPIIDEVLEPGDIIYIPPGFPHNGIALSECLNYSVGFRAPSQKELLSAFADHALQLPAFNKRYKDTAIAVTDGSLTLTTNATAALRDLLQDCLQQPDFERWAASYVSEGKISQLPISPPEPAYHPDEVEELLQSGHHVIKVGVIKTVIPEQQKEPQQFTFYVAGQVFSLPLEDKTLFSELMKNSQWPLSSGPQTSPSVDFIQLLTTLINAGYWYFAEHGDVQDDVES